MSRVTLASFVLMLALLPALAETPTEAEGPLSPCVAGSSSADTSSASSGPAWGVEIASSFDKKEALDEFAQAQKTHDKILGDYSPMVVEVCDLSMGTDLRYAVRIGLDSRDAADALCNKLQAAGGACIVLKN